MFAIAELYVYPVKSCAGVAVDAVELSETGFRHDRNWMVVRDDGEFVTQREEPRLALVRPSLSDSSVTLAAPGMPEFTLSHDETGESLDVAVFGETLRALTCTRQADDWISTYLGGSFRIVAQDRSFYRKGGVQYPARDEAPTTFVDNYGLLVISQASLEDLNARMPEALPVNRFRPNIVLKGPQAFDEDYFTELACDDVKLRFIDLCYRCNLTTIDQQTAEFGQEPLNTLSAYRKVKEGVKFGNYAAVKSGVGRLIHLGQELQAEYNF